MKILCLKNVLILQIIFSKFSKFFFTENQFSIYIFFMLRKNLLFLIFLAMILGAVLFGTHYYAKIFYKNVRIRQENAFYLFIPTNSTFDDVMELLKQNHLLENYESFVWLSHIKNYQNHVNPGKYRLYNNMSNNELINLLRSGRQVPIKLVFTNIRTIENLAGVVGKQIEADSMEISDLLHDEAFIEKFGFDRTSIPALFIPNTYEFYWNTSARKFVTKMKREYDKFWNDSRRNKAKAIGLTPKEVAVLASIVQAEQNTHKEEKPIIAGLYINRLKKRMYLQSDPTIVFAKGDFSIKRVLNRDKAIDSPYNTYKRIGLPPGPINFPEISSLDAVLNYDKNDYLFMCAKEDFSGYHYFAKTNRQHAIYARRYQAALNKQKIYR